MNREEQIEQAFYNTTSLPNDPYCYTHFMEGARWADAHPKKIDVTEFSKQVPSEIQELIDDHFFELLDDNPVNSFEEEDGVEMWIARNDNNQLVLSEGELGYNEDGFEDGWENKEDDGNVIYLRSDLFPELTFENSPQRVKLTLVKE